MTARLYPMRGAFPRAVAALLVATASATAQHVDRAQRPPLPAAQAFKFPNVRGPSVLPNGLRVYVIEDHSVPVVSVRVVTAADSTFDPPAKAGLYAVTLGALSEGTATRSAEQLAAAAADIGTRVTPAGFTTTAALFPRALDLLADMLTRPTLDSDAVQRRKAMQAAAAHRVDQAPVTVPRRVFYAMLYGVDDAFSRSLVPSDATIGSITPEDVAAFYTAYFRPELTSIVVAGDIGGSKAIQQIGRAFAAWGPPATHPAMGDTSVIAPRPTTIYLYDAPGAQAYVYVGALGPARTSARSYAADVLGAIALARFQRALREKRSFMYSGATGFTWRRASHPSAFVGSTVVAARKVDSALVEWLSVLRGLRGSEPVTMDELAAAQRSRVGPLAVRIDGADSLAARVVETVRDSLPLDAWDRYARQVGTLTVRDVTAAADRVLDLDHLVIVVSGDWRVIEPALRAANIAPVVRVDANGRPLSP